MSRFSLSLLLKRGKNNILRLLLKKKLSDDPSSNPGENALTPTWATLLPKPHHPAELTTNTSSMSYG